MLQDSKHVLKTFCNNLFSGAHLLHFRNYAAFYQQVCDMAFEEGTPLYHRDVKKLDWQDDNAASHPFSAPTLHFLADCHPEEVGLIVYLFIFGELCDAYQNHSIGHDKHILLALRAPMYLCLWEQYLNNISDSPKDYTSSLSKLLTLWTSLWMVSSLSLWFTETILKVHICCFLGFIQQKPVSMYLDWPDKSSRISLCLISFSCYWSLKSSFEKLSLMLIIDISLNSRHMQQDTIILTLIHMTLTYFHLLAFLLRTASYQLHWRLPMRWIVWLLY